MSYQPVTHIIFDVDGLLIDSERFYSQALSEVCSKYGSTFTNEIKVEMMGTKPLEGANICLNRMNLHGKVSPEDFVAEYESIMKLTSKDIRLMPGAERLINHLHKHNIPIAIATGASAAGFERKTSHLGDILRKPFKHHVFAGSDPEVKNGKPAPDVFLVAAQRFMPKPESMNHVLVFEDSANGVKAALAANAQAVFVPDPQFCIDRSKIGCEPTLTIDSLEDFKPELFNLPPF